jgi:hypothetical protein
MASSLDPVRRQLSAFLGGGAFLPLRTAVLDAAASVDDDARLSDAERDWFDELYDAVYMAADDPVDRAQAKAGIIGAAALRAHLRELGLDRFAAPPS